MALQVWLPLNGNINNHGLNSMIFTNQTELTWSDGGKIGKTTLLSANHGLVSKSSNIQLTLKKQYTIAFWFRLNITAEEDWTRVINICGSGEDIYTNRVAFCRGSAAVPNMLGFHITRNGNTVTDGYCIHVEHMKWTHVCVTVDYDAGYIKIYQDGILIETRVCPLYEQVNSSWMAICGEGGGASCSVQDVRIYDNIISENELEEIIKCLCVHYTLNEPNSNLVLDSMSRNQNNSAYMVKTYTLSENLINGQVYTYQIKATLSSERRMIGVWVGGGTYTAGFSQKNSKGYYTVTFTADANMANYNTVNVYCSNNTGIQGSTPISGTCYIDWIKIEKGDKATPWISHANDTSPTMVSDASGFGNKGKRVGNIGCDYTSPKYNHGMTFGRSDYILMPYPNGIKPSSLTLSCWVKLNSFVSGETCTIACYEAGGAGISVVDSIPRMQVYDGTYKGAIGYEITDHDWHLYTGTYDEVNGEIKMYIDGALVSTTPAGAIIYNASTNWAVNTNPNAAGGGSANSGGDMSISDVRIYATCLSANDISELYNHAHFELGKKSLYQEEIIETGRNVPLSRFDKTIYIEPDGSKWTRVFHHNNPATYGVFNQSDKFLSGVFIDANKWLDVIPLALYGTELMVKEKITAESAEKKWRWTQLRSPLFTTFNELTNNPCVYNARDEYSSSNRKGLYKRETSNNCFMNVNNGTDGNWWGAIGAYVLYQGGIPAYSAVITTGYYDLYVRIDNVNTIGNIYMTRDGVMKCNTISEQGKNLEAHLPYTESNPFQPNKIETDGWTYIPNSTVEAEPNTIYEFSFRCDGTLSATHASSGSTGNTFTGWLYITNSMQSINFGGYDNPVNFTSGNLYKKDGNKYIWHYRTGDNTTVIGLRVNTYSDGVTPSPIKFWDFSLKKGVSDINPTFSKEAIQSVNYIEK